MYDILPRGCAAHGPEEGQIASIFQTGSIAPIPSSCRMTVITFSYTRVGGAPIASSKLDI